MAKGDLQPVDMSSDVGHSLLLGAAFGLNPFGDEVKKLYEDASKDFGKVIRGVKMTPEEKLFTEKAFKELQIGRDAMAKGEMELPEYQNLRNNLLGEIEKPIKRAVDETPYEIPKIFQNRFNAAQFKGLLYDALVPPMASQVPGLMSGKGFNGKEFLSDALTNTLFRAFHYRPMKGSDIIPTVEPMEKIKVKLKSTQNLLLLLLI
jgi:hypothetical protein